MMQAWVTSELTTVDLGDQRRKARLIKLMDQVSQNPTGTFNEACPTAADKKAAYRFLANEEVAAEAILDGHSERTWERVAETEGRILVVQDTSSVDYSAHSRTQGLGPLENKASQGFFVHSAMALTEAGAPLGMVHQERWVREEAEAGKRHNRRKRPWTEKESYKWQRTVETVIAQRPAETQIIIIGDRESDVYGLLASPQPEGVELLVRSAQNRKVQETEGLLYKAITTGPAAGQVFVEVGRGKDRTPRTAICEVRFREVILQPPAHADTGVPKLPVKISVVSIIELHPPKGEKALRWVLLATWSITNLEQAIEAAAFYSCRWLVERFHYVLKSGCRIEEAQLRAWSRLERLTAVYTIVAWRLLALTYQARLFPDQSCEPLLTREEWQVLYAQRNNRLPEPGKAPPSVAQAIAWVAQLGGHWGRKGDAPPGVKVLWRGLQRLRGLVEGFNLAKSFFQQEQRCG